MNQLDDFATKSTDAIELEKAERLKLWEPTAPEWKDWKNTSANIGIKSVKLDDYGRKIVNVEMPYNRFSWEVNTVCFNIITMVFDMYYKKYNCDLIVRHDVSF